jgi:hypothetical protein
MEKKERPSGFAGVGLGVQYLNPQTMRFFKYDPL